MDPAEHYRPDKPAEPDKPPYGEAKPRGRLLVLLLMGVGTWALIGLLIWSVFS